MKVRDKVNKATKISEIIQTCRYYPLDTEDLLQFYIDTAGARGVDVLSRLKSAFVLVPHVYQQVLFLGHIGAGKSTLLYQLERNLDDVYNVIRFSVHQLLDIESITIADLMCVMYERILSSCEHLIGEDSVELRRAYEAWNETIVVESESKEEASIALGAEAEIGIKTCFVKLLSKLTSSLKLGTTERTKICSTIEKNINDYIDMLNILISTVSQNGGKPILLMFEDLEKIPKEKAEDIFMRHASYFHRIKVHMLLTTPIYLKYHQGFRNLISPNFSATERCPIIAVTDTDRTPWDIGVDTMKQIVYARISEDLIEENALKAAILNSGGILRDLLWIIYEASLSCSGDIIKECDVEFAFIKLQESYGDGLREKQINTIKRIYQDPFAIISDDEELELMRSEIIIEYNGQQWRGIHPAVVKYLSSRGIL